jgi:uncharacterized protein HemY
MPQPERLVQLATKAAATNAGAPHYLTTLGAALYRAGQFEEAARRLEEAARLRGQAAGAREWFFLAMAHQRLGDPEKARENLDRAAAWLDRMTAGAKDNSTALLLQQRLEFQILRREAETLVLGKSSVSID